MWPGQRHAAVGSPSVTADAARIADEVEGRLAPLSVAANIGWWDSHVEATEENAERRASAVLALSDAL